ncbi:hypothetical protein BJY04DRAFT_188517 [Aspergillus karnatakaensis]|uniref:uncharacterized protein n=1 Tax=Aspergillus karnatakaensis TaxID=1810916 RepID=UPI003CCCE549
MSFYPPGWDYDRAYNITNEDFISLTDEQHATLFAGLKEAGLFDKIVAAWARKDQEQEAEAEALKSEDQKLAEREARAPYIDTLKNLFKFDKDWSEWGFVVFRAGGYGGQHDQRWTAFRRRWETILEKEFGKHRGYHPLSDQAMDLFSFRWVEDKALENANLVEVSRRYDELWKDLPRGFATSVGLMVTDTVIDSVLDSPLPSSAPRDDRKELPFVVAVSRAAHIPQPNLTPEEKEEIDPEILNFKGYFNVAIESVLDPLYGIVALDIMDLHRLAGRMKDERDIWVHPYRDGVRFYAEDAQKAS